MSAESLLDEGKAALHAGERSRAENILLPLAEEGHPKAQYYLGMLFSCGNPGEFDKNKAIQWHEAAFAQGFPYSGYQMGELLNPSIDRLWEHFNVEPYDRQKSEWCYSQAVDGLKRYAEQGDPNAAEILGQMYLFGKGQSPNAREAVRWYEQCFLNGGYGAANALWSLFSGCMFHPEIGCDELAVYWYRKMKEHGCQCLLDYRWEDDMVLKGLLGESERSPTGGQRSADA